MKVRTRKTENRRAKEGESIIHIMMKHKNENAEKNNMLSVKQDEKKTGAILCKRVVHRHVLHRRPFELPFANSTIGTTRHGWIIG